jgi:hypothetical protein
MKSTISLCSILILFTLIGCELTKLESEQLYIRGRLFLTDTIFQNSKNTPQANKTIQLSAASDTLNFLYSAQTDSDGYFVFQLAEKPADYRLRYEEKIGGIIYTASLKVSDNQSALLTATFNIKKQNGFYIYCKDEEGGLIPLTSIAIYNSSLLAKLKDLSGAYRQIISNENGLAQSVNLVAGNYYLNAMKVLPSKKDTLFYINRKITIPYSGLIEIKDPIVLR